MKLNPRTILLLAGGILIVSVCVFSVPPLIPNFGLNATPTLTRTPVPTLPNPKPTLTPAPRKSPTPTLFVATDTPTPLPAVPSPFDIILNFTDGSCGTGTPSYTYTFIIDGTSLTINQTDAGITSTGSYDPATGAFSTAADVGPGDETYDGTIGYDGATISVSGGYSWTPDGGATCTFSIAGTSTP